VSSRSVGICRRAARGPEVSSSVGRYLGAPADGRVRYPSLKVVTPAVIRPASSDDLPANKFLKQLRGTILLAAGRFTRSDTLASIPRPRRLWRFHSVSVSGRGRPLSRRSRPDPRARCWPASTGSAAGLATTPRFAEQRPGESRAVLLDFNGGANRPRSAERRAQNARRSRCKRRKPAGRNKRAGLDGARTPPPPRRPYRPNPPTARAPPRPPRQPLCRIEFPAGDSVAPSMRLRRCRHRVRRLWSGSCRPSSASRRTGPGPMQAPMIARRSRHCSADRRSHAAGSNSHPRCVLISQFHRSVPNWSTASNARKGLNETLGARFWELHTLGLRNRHTQNDVTASPKILTGWTIIPSECGPRSMAPSSRSFGGCNNPGPQDRDRQHLITSSGVRPGQCLDERISPPSVTAKHVVRQARSSLQSRNQPPPALVEDRWQIKFSRPTGISELARHFADLARIWSGQRSQAQASRPNGS